MPDHGTLRTGRHGSHSIPSTASWDSGLIMIAQFDMMIDKQIRALIEYEWIHRKVGNIGKGGKLLNAVGGGGLHACVKIYKPLNQKVAGEFFAR